MAPAPHNPVPWHPEEVDFLQRKGAIGANCTLNDLDPVKARWIHNTLREVYIAPSGFVLKRFSHFPGRKDYRRVWQREHQALKRLEGLPVPQSFGYIDVSHATGPRSVLYIRELVPGAPLEAFANHNIRQVAELLASFHARGVITLDPQPENFVEHTSEKGRLAFIDFGRARTFDKRNPLVLFNIGKEMLRLRREGRLDPEQFEIFIDSYRAKRQLQNLEWKLIRSSYLLWERRYQRKERKAETGAPDRR